MTIDRRAFMIGVGAAALAEGWAHAAPIPVADRLFANTPLAGNRVAASFARVDLALPDVAVVTSHGPTPLRKAVTGPRLVTLWAEWCVPCLIEARDLAALKPRLSGPRFGIVSILTGSGAKLDHRAAVERLAKAGATGLDVVVEPNGGRAIAAALSVPPPSLTPPAGLKPGDKVSGFSLPCTLLVDGRGRVRGRASGIAMATPIKISGGGGGTAHRLTETEKQAMMAGGTHTAWATPDGVAFADALRGGLLDRS